MNSGYKKDGNFLLPDGLDALIITHPSNRRYLSGFTGSNGLLLLMSMGKKILLTDFRYVEQAAVQSPGFEIVQQKGDDFETLRGLIQQYNLRRIGIEKEYVTLARYEYYQRKIPGVEFVPVSDTCRFKRMVKTDSELMAVKKAIEIADRTFSHIKDFLSAGHTEKEVSYEIEFFMHRLGSERNAFETIVASGIRGSLPHGTATEKVISSGEMVTLDFGAVYRGYHSDITRTLILGHPAARQNEIYNLVLEAQLAAINNIRPGIRACEVDKIARSIIAQAGYGENFGHGLGHSVGLDIHEEPRFSPRDETILEPGMVITVEPGIYLPGWGGVRIEDIILVTSSGCEVLTKSPKNMQDMIIIHK